MNLLARFAVNDGSFLTNLAKALNEAVGGHEINAVVPFVEDLEFRRVHVERRHAAPRGTIERGKTIAIVDHIEARRGGRDRSLDSRRLPDLFTVAKRNGEVVSVIGRNERKVAERGNPLVHRRVRQIRPAQLPGDVVQRVDVTRTRTDDIHPAATTIRRNAHILLALVLRNKEGSRRKVGTRNLRLVAKTTLVDERKARSRRQLI